MKCGNNPVSLRGYRLSKLWCIYTMEYYSEIRRPTSWTHTVTWIDLMILLLMLSEKNLIGYFYIIPFLGHCCLVNKSCLTLCNPMDSSRAPLSRRLPRQEYWNGLSFPSPGDLSYPGIEHRSPALAGIFFMAEPPGKPECHNEHSL